MVGETILRTATLILASVFVLAIVHKASVVRDAAQQPVIRNRGLTGAAATGALIGAGGIEALAVVTLIIWPALGCLLAVVLLVAYTLELRRLPAGRSCNCLGGAFDAETARGAVARNLMLAGIGAAVGAALAFGGGAGPITEAAVAAALAIVAVTASLAAVRRRIRLQRTSARHRALMRPRSTGGQLADQ